jgi:hypothetical protein
MRPCNWVARPGIALKAPVRLTDSEGNVIWAARYGTAALPVAPRPALQRTKRKVEAFLSTQSNSLLSVIVDR